MYAPWKRGVKRLFVFPFLLFSALLTVLLGSVIFVGGIFFKQYYRGPLGDYASLAPSIVFSLCIPTLGSFFQHVSLRYANFAY